MANHLGWNDPIWQSLYGSPGAPAPTAASYAQPTPDPGYIQILQAAAAENVPMDHITLAGIDEAARNISA